MFKFKSKRRRNLYAVLIFGGLGLLFIASLGQKQQALDYLKSHLEYYQSLAAANLLISYLGFCLGYTLYIGLFLPISTILSLAGGAIFGFWPGLFAVWFGRTAGSLMAFGIAKIFLGESIRERFPRAAAQADEIMANDGASYLFFLRIVPAMPFNATNLAMGLVEINALKFTWITGLGIIPRCALLVNAGVQLAKIERLSDIVSPDVVASLAALGLLPLLLKKLAARKGFKRP